jgi:uncharacterized radical SAM superfamily Fe-S cluster-containing enzyme
LQNLSKAKQKELEDKLFIKNDSYEDIMAKEYLLKNSFIKQGPSLHIIVLTLRCNHACKYCHAYSSSEIME